ncbi:MAG: NADH-quinone oxidoreductase subunit C [Clostridiales bacterium]|nr:NADH-quinone oxidoreductase subunit C [Clostridiales bacterium]
MIENLVEISVGQLVEVAQRMMYDGWRFITATCVDNCDGTVDVFYHFDKDYELSNFKLRIMKETEIPSISRVYFSALLVENEIKELFGINITGIVLDYGGHLLLSDDAPDNPMCRQQIVIVKKGEEKNV